MAQLDRSVPIAVFMLLTAAVGASAQDRDSINWSVTPYIWASDTSLDLTVRDSNVGGSVDVPFNDLLDVIDTAFQIHLEGGRGQWSAFSDITIIETSDTRDRPMVTIDSKSKQTLIDAVVAYWPGGVGSPLNVFGGVRYSAFDERYTFSSEGNPIAERRSDTDYYDALVGLRYRFDFSERWALLTRGDLSFGDSEGTALVQGLFAYTVGKRRQNRILFGYQYKTAEFEDGGLTQDFTYQGPMAGFNFRF